MGTMTCRICGGTGDVFLDLGMQPLSDHFGPVEEASSYRFPLQVACCRDCTMVQLVHEVPRELMFRPDYPYVSSGSQWMRTHFQETAETLLAGMSDETDPFVVELGCNDGVFLRHVADAHVRHIGVEPSARVAQAAADLGVDVRVDFFDEQVAREIARSHGPASLIYAANTLCHIPYMASVLAGVESLLDGGIFVFEDPYFADILERTSFDQIYDEHFYYFTATSVREMARRAGLELVDVEPLSVHGGELRYVLARAGRRPVGPSVDRAIAREQELGVSDPAQLAAFAERVRRNADDLVSFLTDARDRGERVVGYGATAKSATVLNYCGINPDLIPVIYDSTAAKQGCLTPGSHIPVAPSEGFRSDDPAYAVLFAWNHATEVKSKEAEFAAAGGKWVTYVPALNVG